MARRNKIKVITASVIFFMFGCAEKPKDNTENLGQPVADFIDQTFHFSEIADSKFCDKDSIIPGDCGFGELYLSPKGIAILTDFCMGQEQTSYDIGKYNVSDSMITCTFDQVYSYRECSSCDEEEAKKNQKPNDGKLEKVKEYSLQLRRSKCKDFDYYLPASPAQLKDAEPKPNEPYGIKGHVFSKIDKGNLLKDLNSITVLSQILK